MKPIVVQKYGGSSVADVEKIRGVARRIVAAKQEGYHVVAVVSAMGASTDSLLSQAYQISESPKKRELDMLLSVGERVSMSLLAMAIHDLGYEALSFTGSQCGIITSDNHSNAKIIDVRPVRIFDELARDHIVIVAGYQGMSYKRELTTLGRGGSDTTAVALAASLGAKYCEICSDVDGVYDSDPRIVDSARRIDELCYDEMEEMGLAGAGVLNPDAIEFARSRGMKIVLTSTFGEGSGTLLLKREEETRETTIRAVVSRSRIIYIRLVFESGERPGKLIEILEQAEVPLESLNTSLDHGGRVEIILNPERIPDWVAVRECILAEFDGDVEIDDSSGMVSLVGRGIADYPAYLSRSIRILDKAGIGWQRNEVLRNRISFVVDCDDVQRATVELHGSFFPVTIQEEAKV